MRIFRNMTDIVLLVFGFLIRYIGSNSFLLDKHKEKLVTRSELGRSVSQVSHHFLLAQYFEQILHNTWRTHTEWPKTSLNIQGVFRHARVSSTYPSKSVRR